MSSSPIFIADQRIYALQPSAGTVPKQALSLNHLPEFEGLERSYSEWKREETPTKHWRVIDSAQDRRDYLQHLGSNPTKAQDRRLLCVTSSAGIGKSMALGQASFLRSQLSGQVVIEYHFNQLPVSADAFFGNATDATQRSLLQQIEASLEVSLHGMDSEPASRRTTVPTDYRRGVHAWLKKKMERGEVTLFVDGLDELDRSLGESRALALRQLLNENPQLHCMVAGRPYAIVDAYWNSLFAKSASRGRAVEQSDWQFCSVGMFSPDQIRRALGTARASKLASLATEMELTPRTIEVLRGLTVEQFERLHTVADVYWESMQRTLGWDVDRSQKGLQHGHVDKINADQYVEYVSALAITMFLADARETVVSEIQNDVLERLQTLPAWKNESLRELAEKQTAIRELNAGCVEFRVFDTFDTQVKWRNNTLRDFYAALWLVRYSSQGERDRFAERIPKKFTLWNKDRSVHPDCQEAWSFVSSMPSQAMLGSARDKHERRLELIEHLFKKPTSVPRPTEMMVRAWPGLLITAGYLDASQRHPTQEQVATDLAAVAAIKDMPVIESTGEARAKTIVHEFLREFVHLEKHSPRKSLVRKRLLQFLREFIHFEKHIDGARVIREDLVFHEIPAPDSGWERVSVGHEDEENNPPRTVALPGPFRVGAFPVTRRLYRLFDASHEPWHAEDFKSYSKHERCPAIDITWWDARMFAVWSHSRLLSEYEWEYACRGNCRDTDGKLSKYYWPDDPKGKNLEKHAWIDANSGNQTHPVGGLAPNVYQLHDMLGNVWEWTESVYSADRVFRVLRGGSFNYYGRGATVSFGSLDDPSAALHYVGCRVARASLRKS
jgi:hypothetical protein